MRELEEDFLDFLECECDTNSALKNPYSDLHLKKNKKKK